jgi:glutamate racemase
VLATGVTLAGERFNSLVERFGEGVEVYTQPCPGLVELVESGRWERPEAEAMLGRYLDPLLARGVDTIVLGCTHYPFLRSRLRALLPEGVALVDTGAAVSRHLQYRLQETGMLAAGPARPARFWSSGDPAALQRVLPVLWGGNGDVSTLSV